MIRLVSPFLGFPGVVLECCLFPIGKPVISWLGMGLFGMTLVLGTVILVLAVVFSTVLV